MRRRDDTGCRRPRWTGIVVLMSCVMSACGSNGGADGPSVSSTVPVGGLPASSAPVTTVHLPARRVVLLGDSLARETAPYLQTLLVDKVFVPLFFVGAAPCDWLDVDLQATADSVVVVSFNGNSLTACMADGAGGFLSGQALIDRYRADLEMLIGKARSVGADVILVGQPIRRSDLPGNDAVAGLNVLYRNLAEELDLGYVDGGAAVEGADGAFAERLPCLEGERQCDTDGTNPVRSDDGLHFCPGAPLRTGSSLCPRYSSGAFRFATAIAGLANVI